MNEFLTYEYAVSMKKAPKYRRLRVLLISLYILYCLSWFIVVLAANVGPLLAPLIALVPVSCWMLVFFTFRYANFDNEYSMTSGVLTFTRIYGGRTRKVKLEVVIHDMLEIAPCDHVNSGKIDGYAPTVIYDATTGLDSPDKYFALFENSKGERSVLYFEATARALQILRHYNAKTVVTKVRY